MQELTWLLLISSVGISMIFNFFFWCAEGESRRTWKQMIIDGFVASIISFAISYFIFRINAQMALYAGQCDTCGTHYAFITSKWWSAKELTMRCKECGNLLWYI